MGAFDEHGRGLLRAEGVLDDCHFIVGTFQTLGAIGGCVSDDPTSTSCGSPCAYMFTAAPPPSIAAWSARRCARQAGPELRKQLWDNVATLFDGLKEQGFTLGPEHGPVVGVHCPTA